MMDFCFASCFLNMMKAKTKSTSSQRCIFNNHTTWNEIYLLQKSISIPHAKRNHLKLSLNADTWFKRTYCNGIEITANLCYKRKLLKFGS